jgi:hypothetical protein
VLLSNALRRDGFASVAEAVGTDVALNLRKPA